MLLGRHDYQPWTRFSQWHGQPQEGQVCAAGFAGQPWPAGGQETVGELRSWSKKPRVQLAHSSCVRSPPTHPWWGPQVRWRVRDRSSRRQTIRSYP